MTKRYSFYDYLQELRGFPLTPMQYLSLLNKVRIYFEYRQQFLKANTPEYTALARWSMQDAEQDYNLYCRELGINAPNLWKIKDAVY